jgi:hypothetical protein
MKKILFSLSLLSISLVSAAQYRIMSYYPSGVYGDYVIVYGYYTSNGIFTLSHCRTNRIANDIYSSLTYLDIETCTFKHIQQDTTAAAPAGIAPPPPPPVGQKAF